MSSPPTALISRSCASESKPANSEAPAASPPWYTRITTSERSTPQPSVAAKAIAVKPSSTLLIRSSEPSPVSPFRIAPRNVNGPTQKTMLAVTKPSAMVLVAPGAATRRWIDSPNALSRRSMPKSEPITPPMTIAPNR